MKIRRRERNISINKREVYIVLFDLFMLFSLLVYNSCFSKTFFHKQLFMKFVRFINLISTKQRFILHATVAHGNVMHGNVGES